MPLNPAPSSPAMSAPQVTRPELGTSTSQPQMGPTLSAKSPPQAPFFLSSGQECVVCRRPIEQSFQEKDTWKSYHQPLALRAGSDQLVAAEQYLPGRNAWVHSCCWEVTRNALGCLLLDHGSLAGIVGHLLQLGPFASRTPFDCETHDIDHELGAESPTELKKEFGNKKDIPDILSSPPAQETIRWLDQGPRTLLMEDLVKKDNFLAYCLRKAMPYSLANEETMDVRPQLAKVIQNLKSSDASRLPKTHNLWVAWSNVMSAFDAMKNSPRPLLLNSNPELCEMVALARYCVPAEKCHRLTFSFVSMAIGPSVMPTWGLSGVAWDGKCVGSGAYKDHVRVTSLRGIHLVRAGFGGVTAIRVKDGEEWSSWYGTPWCGREDLKHEWHDPNKDLIFNFDVSKPTPNLCLSTNASRKLLIA